MCFDYDGYCEVWQESFPKARKPHKCCECGGVILKGHKYRNIFSVYEGDATTSKVCMPCEAVRDIIRQHENDEGCDGNEAEAPIGELAASVIQGDYGLCFWDRENDMMFVSPFARHLVKHGQLEICV